MNNNVNMRPNKNFFIQAITKDISLMSAIFEFVDNSIKAAKRISKRKNLKGYYVNIKIDNNISMKVEDNCYGISQKDALSKAFRLGNDFKDSKDGFGIGMKRALFKLANKFEVISCTDNESFKVEIDVDKWIKKDKWSTSIIPYQNQDSNYRGTIINIKQLTGEAKSIIERKDFLNKLRKEIKDKYYFIIESGFRILINGEEVVINPIKDRKVIHESPEYCIGNNILRILVEKRTKNENNNWGWNFIINGRVISNGDYTFLKDSNLMEFRDCNFIDKFIGNIFINGDDVSKLPIQTTKDELDKDSKEYKKILNYMKRELSKVKSEFLDIEKSITYKKPLNEIEKLKEKFNVKSNADVGRRSFEDSLGNSKN